jgi:hypothetical protein
MSKLANKNHCSFFQIDHLFEGDYGVQSHTLFAEIRPFGVGAKDDPVHHAVDRRECDWHHCAKYRLSHQDYVGGIAPTY